MGALTTLGAIVAIRLDPFLERAGQELGTRLAHLVHSDEECDALSTAVAESLLAGLLASQLGAGSMSNAEVS